MVFQIIRKFSCRLFHTKSTAFFGVIIFAICMIALIAGLWPFEFHPVNKVSWLGDRNGVNFYGQSMIVSPILWDDQQKSPFDKKSITIELWVHPPGELSDGGIGRIVSLHDGQEPDLLFLGQWKSHLVIWSRIQINESRLKKPVRRRDYGDVGLLNALTKDNDQFLTITSGAGGTSIYLNGKLAIAYSNYNVLSGFAGIPCRLILGNSPTGGGYWTGYLSGLAIYNQTLTSAQVLKSYRGWMDKGYPSTPRENGCTALYLFNERKGTMVNNHMDTGNQLLIPEIFTPLRRIVLSPPWNDFRWDKSSLQDITINITGFIPFGFFCAAFLCKMRQFRKSTLYLTTALIGLGFSLAIELLQVYLPTRHSQLTDVICNVIGTVMGLVLFHKTVFPASEDTRGSIHCDEP